MRGLRKLVGFTTRVPRKQQQLWNQQVTSRWPGPRNDGCIRAQHEPEATIATASTLPCLLRTPFSPARLLLRIFPSTLAYLRFDILLVTHFCLSYVQGVV